MQFETLSASKFKPLTRQEQLHIKAGQATPGGMEQAGTPRWDEANECYTVPMRFWASDSFINGEWCYDGQRYGAISARTLNPAPM